MGANNCKSKEDVDNVLDNTFRLLYAQLFLYSLEIMVPISIPFTYIFGLAVFYELSVY